MFGEMRSRNKEAARLYTKKYRITHPLTDEQRQENAIRCGEWRTYHPNALRLWHKRHLSRYKGYKAKYRAGKKGNGGSFTWQEWEHLRAEYGYLCPLCLRREPDIILVPDHIRPISKGGTSDIDNIQPLCKSCNSWKSNKTDALTPGYFRS